MKILIAPYPKELPKQNPKAYPYWGTVVRGLGIHELVQIGLDGEKALVKDFRKGLSLSEIRKLVHWCDVWVSVDSFLQHLANHEGKRGVVIWGPSDPMIYGYRQNVNLLKSRSGLRPDQFGIWDIVSWDHSIFPAPEDVILAVQEVGNGNIDR